MKFGPSAVSVIATEDIDPDDDAFKMKHLIDNIEDIAMQISDEELQVFVHADDESNEEFAAAILEDIEEILHGVLEDQLKITENADIYVEKLEEPDHIDSIQFVGFEKHYSF